MLSCVLALTLIGAPFCLAQDDAAALVVPDIVTSERERCGGIFDMHLHLSPWFSEVDGLLDELDVSLVDQGILYAVYPRLSMPGQRDPNEVVSEMALASKERIFGFASLNTTHDDWSATKETELNRLLRFLDRPEFVGAKLAPPHTCLPLAGERIEDVVHAVAGSSTPILAIHVGTTPFCGPLGEAVGLKTCCSREYVDPSLLAPLMELYSNTTFILLHAGHDFLPPDDPKGNYYNGTLVDKSIQLALDYDNVYLEISAMHAEAVPREMEDNFKYPGGYTAIQKMADAGAVDKIIWASDGNHIKGALVEVMKESFEDMIKAGMTDDQRCAALIGTPKALFGIPDLNSTLVSLPTPDSNSTSASAFGPMHGWALALGYATTGILLRMM